ncbi:MAG: M28 family metallopeptidase [Anaerolineales bacterium]|nr:M28 family metallopeptidase [Anaerolineales bacterium]
MSELAQSATGYLEFLCRQLPGRCVGTPGNKVATDWFAKAAAAFGFRVETPGFDCLGWEQAGAELSSLDRSFAVLPSPYSLGCDVRGELAVAGTFEELQQAEAEGRVLLVHGKLARQQLMPKRFPFYNPEEHQQIISWLELKRPLAIVAATGRDPDLAGGICPFPLIEDGDFDIPCAHMTQAEGLDLSRRAGQSVELKIRARRSPARGCNVQASKGPLDGRRVVVFAHIDAKLGTPGALDNAAGVAALLLLAELLQPISLALAVELVAMNGEDYYSAPGEQLYVQQNQERFGEIVLGINVDGAGDRHGDTAFSLYGCPPEIAGIVRQSFGGWPGMIEGEAWYQSDHSLFVMHHRPALAATSARFTELWSVIAHTELDVPELVSPDKLGYLALALRDVVVGLQGLGSIA